MKNMKHLRLYENNRTIQSIRKLKDDYYNFMIEIKPYVYEKYIELANDESYSAEQEDQPRNDTEIDDLFLTEYDTLSTGFQFLMSTYDNDGEVENNYYIFISNKEMENVLLRMDSDKFNL